MLNIEVSYPPLEDEVQIVLQTTSTDKPSPAKVMDGPAILSTRTWCGGSRCRPSW